MNFSWASKHRPIMSTIAKSFSLSAISAIFLAWQIKVSWALIRLKNISLMLIPKSLEESEIWQGAAMNLSQANPTPKQLNLNKLSDASGSQIHWQATLAKTDS